MPADDDPVVNPSAGPDHLALEAILGLFAERAAAEIERMRTERALRASEERFRSLVESTKVAVWELDARALCFTYMSPHIKAITGHPAADWTDFESWRQRIHPDDRERTVQSCLAATRLGKDHDLEFRVVAPDGRVAWVREVIRVTSDADGPASLRGVTLDVSGRHSAEEAADRILESRPETRVLFMTGYAGDSPAIRGLGVSPGAVLKKPFAPTALARSVRELLDR
jgi:PAS domain S-box-containing protein